MQQSTLTEEDVSKGVTVEGQNNYTKHHGGGLNKGARCGGSVLTIQKLSASNKEGPTNKHTKLRRRADRRPSAEQGEAVVFSS